jgi:hypothetical protein
MFFSPLIYTWFGCLSSQFTFLLLYFIVLKFAHLCSNCLCKWKNADAISLLQDHWSSNLSSVLAVSCVTIHHFLTNTFVVILTFFVAEQSAVFFCTPWRFQSFGFLDGLLQKLFSSINLLCANFSNLKAVVGFLSHIVNDNFEFCWLNDI